MSLNIFSYVQGPFFISFCELSIHFFFPFFSLLFSPLIIYLFILAAPGLSCSMGDLHCSMRDLQLQHADFLVVACGIQFSDRGSNPGPLHWERGVLSVRPSGKSLFFPFFYCLLAPVSLNVKKIFFFSFSFFGHVVRIAGSQFPEQGLNLGPGQ